MAVTPSLNFKTFLMHYVTRRLLPTPQDMRAIFHCFILPKNGVELCTASQPTKAVRRPRPTVPTYHFSSANRLGLCPVNMLVQAKLGIGWKQWWSLKRKKQRTFFSCSPKSAGYKDVCEGAVVLLPAASVVL